MTIRDAFRNQAKHGAALGSPIKERLMNLAAERMMPGTKVGDRILGWTGDAAASADSVPLRFAGALHALKLQGVALVDVYPPNVADEDALWSSVQTAIATHEDHILRWLEAAPQTNEVRRAAVLLPCLAILHRAFGLPVELLELGTSAGLNLRADQFNLKSNARAHYLHTSQEIIRQTNGEFDAFCDFAGTGGSFAGCARGFKEHDQAIRCFLVEPTGAAILAGEAVTNPNHRIQGGGYSMLDLPLVNKEHVDGYIQVDDEDAIKVARRLAKEEGIFAGFSSGANVAAALQLLEGAFKGKTIVVLLSDSGLKYLSTDLWE